MPRYTRSTSFAPRFRKPDRPLGLRRLAALALLAVTLAACGSDVTLELRTSFGTIDDPPSCIGDGGSFSFEEEGGLVIVVFLDDDTVIRAPDGDPADCEDLKTGTEARVRGDGDDDRIDADEVDIL